MLGNYANFIVNMKVEKIGIRHLCSSIIESWDMKPDPSVPA